MADIQSSVTEANRYRTEGNEHFRSFRYHNAILSYTKSLDCQETSQVLANRAQAYLNIRQYERALIDAARAIELDANNIKALFRYAKALENLGLHEVAADKLSKINPTNQKNKEVAELKRSVQGKVNCEEVRLFCGEKDEFLRSKMPLMEIKNIEVIAMESAEQSSKTDTYVLEVANVSDEPSVPLIPPPPATSFNFISDFQTLKYKPVSFAEYFLSIDQEKHKDVLDDVIETEMIECIITGYDMLANNSNIYYLLESLVQLAGVSRFEIAVMFLDETAKEKLRQLAGRHPVNEELASMLHSLYVL
ncbi:unnamed protein product [Thelazia callipaeda]|uniref:RNA polymerase II-associated protein 3 n=1 Tax=Thelazia callipaeda TaxID=103827 RepID=A0A0N5CXS8_THECL|nr:unnamed protein product [Thelazia callipaeda]